MDLFVHNSEVVARFILRTSWLRQDKTIKPKAFRPPPNLELSVTRKKKLGIEDLSLIGKSVAIQRELKLLGWANIKVSNINKLDLRTVAHPLPDNPHHANIIGWPEKAAQKSIIQQLAEQATFEAVPSAP